MSENNVVLIAVLAACALLAVWPALWAARHCQTPGSAAIAGFVAAYALAVAAAFAAGIVLDLVRNPFMPTPKPGNFTLPLPWALVAPWAQAVTGGPAIGLIIGFAAAAAVRRRTPTAADKS